MRIVRGETARLVEENNLLKRKLNEAVSATSIAFVVLAESGSIDETTATEHADTFAVWEPDVDYVVGNLRRYGEDEARLWRCIQAHRSQADWTPDKAVSLWAKAGDPAEEWPQWSQPIGAADAYMAGDQVTHNDKHWISDYDNNVWEPGIFGWHEAD